MTVCTQSQFYFGIVNCDSVYLFAQRLISVQVYNLEQKIISGK